ncbi:MAG: DUF4360 domain-containing protein [Bdellovibrionales bacterium]|nr:DUF4360 domain-containing protein [Bdellovibrionales bacterium]
MKKSIVISFTLLLSIMNNGYSAHKVGNGGDYIRGTFISMGKVVAQFLGQTKEGQKILAEQSLDLEALEESLDINRILVTDSILKDNTGSVVDALGVESLVTLNSSAWFNHFENGRDVYYLVFHEMLRSIAVDDDNYKISNALKNFPLSLRIETRVAPATPLMAEDLLSGIFSNNIVVGGTGCKSSDREVITELNEEKNIFQISMKNYRTNLSAGKNIDLKSCAISIPVKVPEKKRVVISLIDLGGEFDLQANSTSKVSFEAFLSGGQQKTIDKNLGKGLAQVKSFLMRRTDVLKSSCGGNDLMRINSNISSQSTSSKNEFVTVKSIALYMTLEDCKK